MFGVPKSNLLTTNASMPDGPTTLAPNYNISPVQSMTLKHFVGPRASSMIEGTKYFIRAGCYSRLPGSKSVREINFHYKAIDLSPRSKFKMKSQLNCFEIHASQFSGIWGSSACHYKHTL